MDPPTHSPVHCSLTTVMLIHNKGLTEIRSGNWIAGKKRVIAQAEKITKRKSEVDRIEQGEQDAENTAHLMCK